MWKERLIEATAEVISFSTLNLPCWCNNCSGVKSHSWLWVKSHSTLGAAQFFHHSISIQNISLSVILKTAVSSQWRTKITKHYLPCCGYFGPVWSILIHLSAVNRINRLSFSLSQYSKRLRGKQLNCFTQLPLHPHSAYKRHYVSSINLAPNDVDVVSVVSRSLSISNWQPARFAGSEVDLKWIWLCFPITALSLDKPRPRFRNKHIITPIWHMTQIYSCGSTCILWWNINKNLRRTCHSWRLLSEEKIISYWFVLPTEMTTEIVCFFLMPNNNDILKTTLCMINVSGDWQDIFQNLFRNGVRGFYFHFIFLLLLLPYPKDVSLCEILHTIKLILNPWPTDIFLFYTVVHPLLSLHSLIGKFPPKISARPPN